MALSILEATRYHQGRLHAFTVMSHHIHLLLTPNENQKISQFMQSFKTQTSKELTPLLNVYELSQLKQQTGLNRRSFWKVSFRGLPVHAREVFLQKVNYIHSNPVRSGFVEVPEDYLWSSGHLYATGLCEETSGIRIREAIDVYESMLI